MLILCYKNWQKKQKITETLIKINMKAEDIFKNIKSK